ncbi:AbiV family abortive infection protein [Pseudomonas baltica]|uniref:AbiV family abortive infection protein n=1 Tax=Pseudomonas baltica TaxID=2762576 RepID=A0A7X1KRT1_9PSED|nr:AbiV family abortive infection protein [Pseudomonas baltica]MBC2676933.1 AbiV family abortive infection protein [Pseudomonas baltica]
MLSLAQIDDYIDALSANAESLISEAEILYSHQHYARAFTLSHIAREEIAKCLMLQATGVRILAGHKVDFKKLFKRLRNHEQKLISEGLQNCLFALGVGSSEIGSLMLKNVTAASEHRNNRKNESLYVGFAEGRLSQPAEGFSEKQAGRNITIAQFALRDQKHNVMLMGKFSKRAPIEIPEINPVDLQGENLEALMERLAKALHKIRQINPYGEDSDTP